MANFLRFRSHDGTVKPIDFLKYRYISALLSAIILVGFVGAYFYKKHTTPDDHTFNYSVDFTGGIQLLMSFNKPVQGEKLVHILDEKGWPGSVTREFSPS